jgi:acyl carrier protein
LSAQQVKEIFAEVLGIPIEKVTAALAYDSIPEWDSFAHMNLVAVLDETFGITIAVDDVGQMLTVAATMEILTRYNVPTSSSV